MELRDLLVALNLDAPLSVQQLYEKFNIAGSRDREETLKISLEQARKKGLEGDDASRLKSELTVTKKAGIEIITVFDAAYPSVLKEIFDPPSVIYIQGSFKEADLSAVAVVGSRRATFEGLSFAQKISFSLAGCGITVVSGLARGIDSAAHQGALEAGGRTIAVLGSGFGHMYPAMNRGLSQKITRQGAVISEFSYFTEPFRFNFPRRNRIISGLSVGVLVVEAAQRSGSLITADFALEQGREVFAVPGFANTPNSKGTNALIKQGAVLIEDVEDIIEALPFHIKDFLNRGNSDGNSDGGIKEKLEKDPLNVYNFLGKEPLPIDVICQSLKLDSSRVLSVLLELQIKDLVVQLPGKLFCKK